MKIALIAAGAAGMYCGSCLRDNAVAKGLLDLGHDVTLIPLYTPLRLDRNDVQSPKVFFGGINIFLQQKFNFFRSHRLFDGLFNSRPLLNLASKLQGMTDAKMLGELTVSTLLGEQGNQVAEVHKLADWLASDLQPDLVNLPNAMFVGAARAIREKTGAPIVCSLTGEDLFLEDLVEPYRSESLAALRAQAGEVDAFIATSRYFADFMAEYMEVDREKIHVVPLGLELEGFGRKGERQTDPFTVGYMARIAPEKGFHILCQAFRELKKMPGAEGARFHVAGYLAPKDKLYFEEWLQKLREWGLEKDFRYFGEVSFGGKIELLDSISVLSVPTVYREPKGLFVLEALAHGIPAVLPSHGAFVEMAEATGGIELFPPEDFKALAGRLFELLESPDRAQAMADKGRRSMNESYTAKRMAENTLAVYQKMTQQAAASIAT